MTVLHNDIEQVILDEGIIVLNYIGVVHFAENVNFIYSLHPVFRFHLFDIDLLHDVGLVVSFPPNSEDNSEGAFTQLILDLEIGELGLRGGRALFANKFVAVHRLVNN